MAEKVVRLENKHLVLIGVVLIIGVLFLSNSGITGNVPMKPVVWPSIGSDIIPLSIIETTCPPNHFQCKENSESQDVACCSSFEYCGQGGICIPLDNQPKCPKPCGSTCCGGSEECVGIFKIGDDQSVEYVCKESEEIHPPGMDDDDMLCPITKKKCKTGEFCVVIYDEEGNPIGGKCESNGPVPPENTPCDPQGAISCKSEQNCCQNSNEYFCSDDECPIPEPDITDPGYGDDVTDDPDEI